LSVALPNMTSARDNSPPTVIRSNRRRSARPRALTRRSSSPKYGFSRWTIPNEPVARVKGPDVNVRSTSTRALRLPPHESGTITCVPLPKTLTRLVVPP